MWSIFHAIKRSWTQHFITQFSSLVVMSLTMGAVFLIALSLHNLQKVFDTWGQVNRLTAYMSEKADESERKEIESYLSQQNIVKSHRLVGSRESAEKFKTHFQKLSTQSLSAKKIASFFPTYYEIQLDQKLSYRGSKGPLSQFAQDLSKRFKSLQNISFGKQWLERYIALLSNLKWIGYTLISLFMAATLIICANVIKTLLYARREEIEILEFIGADELLIYFPQILNVIFLGFFSMLTALVGIYGAFKSFQSLSPFGPSVQSQLEFLPVSTLAFFFFSFFISILFYSVFTVFNILPGRKKQQILSEVLR